jgi:nitrogen-specific signal transduction histidine kinase
MSNMQPRAGTLDSARRKVAHEIRNSLGAIRAATELLERHYSPPAGREQRLFQVLLKEIDRLGEITEDELSGDGDG